MTMWTPRTTSVYVAWTSAGPLEKTAGPWSEFRQVAEDLALIESDAGLSRVYHELKWSLPEGASLFVAPLAERPKLKRLPAGTTTWLRDRLP